MQQPVGDHTLVRIHGALVLKLAQMMHLRAKIMGDEGNMFRALCKMVTRGNRRLIDPIRRLTDRM